MTCPASMRDGLHVPWAGDNEDEARQETLAKMEAKSGCLRRLLADYPGAAKRKATCDCAPHRCEEDCRC